ncbi:hypothetical protein HDU86_003371 [Geranomyces michiganensis]|nr:hypothetical protein HDU86_003371 [Geranomyces michiganensis]
MADATVGAWTRFLQMKATAAETSLNDAEVTELRAIWTGLVAELPSRRGADRLRTVAILMRNNRLDLSPEDLQHLIFAHRLLRNWAEVTWEYQALKTRQGQGQFPAMLPSTYECAILAFVRLGLHDKAYGVLTDMSLDGAIPTVRSFTTLLQDAIIRHDRPKADACVADLDRLQVGLDMTCLAVIAVAWRDNDYAERLEQLALKHKLSGYESDPDYHATKGVLYSRLGLLEEAGSELDFIRRQAAPEANRALEALYTAMIRASFLCEGSHGLTGAETLFTDMKAMGLLPNIQTYTVVMHGYYKRRAAHDVLRIYEEMVTAGLQADATIHNIVLRTCVLHDDIYTMFEIFERLVSTGVELPPHVLASVMAGYARCGEPSKAVEVFERHLQGNGVRPDLTCYNVLILACGLAGDVNGCIHWWNRMLEQGLAPDKISYTSFLHALSCTGDTRVESMYHRVFSTEVEPDSLARELLIKDRLRRGDFEQALQYFDALLASQDAAKLISTGSVEALSTSMRRRDDLPGAWKLIRQFLDTGAKPDIKLYHALIDLMRASSRPDEVIKLWKGMLQERVEPDRLVYAHVLSAYAAQRDSEGLWAAVEDMRSRRIIITVGLWEQIMHALTRDQHWSPGYLEHACRAIIQDHCSLTVSLFELLVQYALSTDAPPDLLEDVISYCLQPRRMGRTDDEEARLALYSFVLGPQGNERWAHVAVQSMVEQKEYRCLKEATKLVKESEDLDTLFHIATRSLQLPPSREADVIVNDLLDAVCARSAERPSALSEVFHSALSAGDEDGTRPLRIMQMLYGQEGGAHLLHRCWKVAATVTAPATVRTAAHVFAGFLDWAFLKRRDPETVLQVWDYLVFSNRSLLTLDIISVYVRFLASRSDADGIIKVATDFLTDPRLTKLDRDAVVRNVLKLMRWKWPERVATVIEFWQDKEGVDSKELTEEFL